MVLKFVIFLACVMAASAGVLTSGILQPGIITKTLQPVDAPAKYAFSYQVNDHTTGDIKSQEETRDGDIVKGVYTLIDADGLQRVVHYTSDDINGFNAVVSRTPLTKQVALAPAVPVIKTIQPTIIKGIPSGIQGPLIKTSSLGVPLGLGPLIG